MLRGFFPDASMGIIVFITKSVLPTPYATAYRLVCCSTSQLIYLYTFWSYEKFSNTGKSSWCNKAKVVTLPSYQFLLKSSRNETRNRSLTLNGLIRDSSRKPFQMQSPPRCYQPHKNSVLSFKSRPGTLECNHHTSRIQIWPIRNKQANVFLWTQETMDADPMEICGTEQLILSFRFRKCIEV